MKRVNGCLSCKWADYLRTPEGKKVRGKPLTCRYPKKELEEKFEEFKMLLPSSMRYITIVFNAQAMWPEDGEDGKDCPVWGLSEGC